MQKHYSKNKRTCDICKDRMPYINDEIPFPDMNIISKNGKYILIPSSLSKYNDTFIVTDSAINLENYTGLCDECVHKFIQEKTCEIFDNCFYCSNCNDKFKCGPCDTQAPGCASCFIKNGSNIYIYCYYGSKYDGERYLIINKPNNIDSLTEICDKCINTFMEKNICSRKGTDYMDDCNGAKFNHPLI